MSTGHDREAARQQRLLQDLWRGVLAEPAASDEPDPVGLAGSPPGPLAGLQVYRANAAAHAELALAARHPTVAALVGAEGCAALARGLWQQHPPERGDLGEWGSALPAFIAAQDALAPEPYLADSARLDALVHQASRAADAVGDGRRLPTALGSLAEQPAQALRLVLRPGCGLLRSAWPVASIWHAHQPAALHAANRFDAVRAAFAAERGEAAFVWREGLQVCVEAVDTPTADFTAAVLDRASLAAALDAAGPAFDFAHWLQRAVQEAWLVDVARLAGDSVDLAVLTAHTDLTDRPPGATP